MCEYCYETFGNLGALGSHQNGCKHKKLKESKRPEKTVRELLLSGQDSAAVSLLSPAAQRFVGGSSESEKKTDGRSNNRGNIRRHNYSYAFKYNAILRVLVDNEAKNDVAASIAIQVTHLNTWIAEFEKIKIAFLEDAKAKRYYGKGRLQLRARYFHAEKLLHKEIIEVRKRGRRVSVGFICRRMSALVRKMYLDDQFPVDYNWMYNLSVEAVNKQKVYAAAFHPTRDWRCRFYSRYNLVHRARTNKKQQAIEERVVIWGQQHCETRDFFINRTEEAREAKIKNIDPIYGHFTPQNRYNFDQIPLPLASFKDDTITTKGEVQVVVHGTNNDEKRFASLHLCLRAMVDYLGKNYGKQPPITIIFRGKGKRINKAEKDAYDPRVHVMYQAKAWFDRPTALQWDAENFAVHIEERTKDEGSRPETIGFCDNLDSQTHVSFHEALKSHGTTRSLLKAKQTEALQSIDVGIAAILKWLIGDEQDQWLMLDESHLELWEGKMTASMRRILVTRWVGTAHERLCRDYQSSITKCFLKCGQLITINGAFDDKIVPMSGIDYKFSTIWEAHKQTVVSDIITEIISAVEVNIGILEGTHVEVEKEVTEEILIAGAPDMDQEDEDENEDYEEMGMSDDDYELMDGTDECEELDSGEVTDEVLLSGEVEMTENGADHEAESESWNQCLELAHSMFDTNTVVVEDLSQYRWPKRLTGLVVIWFCEEDNEWDVLRIDKMSTDIEGAYRLQSISAGTWHYEVILSAEKYGRVNRAFVLLHSIAGGFVRAP